MVAKFIINLFQDPSANEQNISRWPEAVVVCVIIICLTIILIKLGNFLRDYYEVRRFNSHRKSKD